MRRGALKALCAIIRFKDFSLLQILIQGCPFLLDLPDIFLEETQRLDRLPKVPNRAGGQGVETRLVIRLFHELPEIGGGAPERLPGVSQGPVEGRQLSGALGQPLSFTELLQDPFLHLSSWGSQR